MTLFKTRKVRASLSFWWTEGFEMSCVNSVASFANVASDLSAAASSRQNLPNSDVLDGESSLG